MTALAATFSPPEAYARGPYALLPFNFLELDPGRYVLTNAAGQHLVLPRDALSALVEGRLPADSPHLRELEAGHFVSVGPPDSHLELLAAQVRTRRDREWGRARPGGGCPTTVRRRGERGW